MSVINVGLEYFPMINFAMQQNNYNYIQKIIIANTAGYQINDVWLTLSFEPQFAENISIRIGTIMPGQIIELGTEHLKSIFLLIFLSGLLRESKDTIL